MTLSIGFDFRATAGFVTDTPPNIFWSAFLYPRSYGTGNAGWSVAPGTRDRLAGNPPQLAGICFGTGPTFSCDLPSAGSYNIRLALGDATFAHAVGFRVFDGAAVLASQPNVTPPINSYMDATGVIRTAATWVAANQPLALTFAGTSFKITPFSGDIWLAYVGIESVSPPAMGGKGFHIISLPLLLLAGGKVLQENPVLTRRRLLIPKI